MNQRRGVVYAAIMGAVFSLAVAGHAQQQGMNRILSQAAEGGNAAAASAGSGNLGDAWVQSGRSFENFAVSGAAAVSAGSGGSGRALLAADTTPRQIEAASVPVPAPTPPGNALGSRLWRGSKKGAQSGFVLGFGVVESPAIALLSKGMDRGFKYDLDGYRFFTWSGAILGAILYIPALAVGVVGGILGAAAGSAAEAVKPGATKNWWTF